MPTVTTPRRPAAPTGRLSRRPRHTRGATAIAGLTAVALTVGACGNGGSTGTQQEELTVVASTSVWGTVAEAVAVSHAQVESIISNSEADPHSYKSTPRDAATISNADLVVYNGGGYDPFVKQILSSTSGQVPVVRAVRVADRRHGGEHGSGEHGGSSHGGAHSTEQTHGAQARTGGSHSGHSHSGHEHGNEHVWYDPHTVHSVAERIADELARLEPEQAKQFHRAAAEFTAEVEKLEQRIHEIRERHAGTKIIATSPVSDLLLEQAGLDDITPPSFVQAVESGSDPAAATIARMQELVKAGKAAVLVYNPQTATPLTERLRTRAQKAGTPVVRMTETPPEGKNYVEWMSGQIDDLRAALNQSARPGS